MRTTTLLLTLCGALAACTPGQRPGQASRSPTGSAAMAGTRPVADFTANRIVFHPDSISGHFADPRHVDTVRTCVMNRSSRQIIDSVPAQAEWIDNQQALDEQDAATALYSPRTDTLWLGYFVNCLLNIGDVNGDGLDELAISDDAADMSRMNSCQIYSRKNGRWVCILTFNVHEAAFDHDVPGDSLRNMNRMIKIPAFLKRQGGHWYFQDYLEDDGLMDRDGNLPWHRIGPRFGPRVTYSRE